MLNEISPELVGKVNKARMIGNKPSKTPAGDKTRSIAVRKAWLKTKVGTVKEEGEAGGPANHAGLATSTSDVHWSKRQPKVGMQGKLKKYGQPMLFKAMVRRKQIGEQLHNPPMKKVYYKKIGKYVPAVSRTSSSGGGSDGSESVQHEHIVKVGSQYRLVSKSSGKNLGTYPTKAGAEKREKQVQYFKHQG